MVFGLEKMFGHGELIRDNTGSKQDEVKKAENVASSDRLEAKKLKLFVDEINLELNEIDEKIRVSGSKKELEQAREDLLEQRKEISTMLLDHNFSAEEAEAYIAEVAKNLHETKRYFFTGDPKSEDLPLQ